MVKTSLQLIARDHAKRWGCLPQLPRQEYDIDLDLKRPLIKGRAS